MPATRSISPLSAIFLLALFASLLSSPAASQAAPGWNYIELYAFGANPYLPDGAQPEAGMVRDDSGNLYGTTFFGGGGTGCDINFNGCGVVFEVTPGGTETVLHAFSGPTDGWNPTGRLIRDSAGNLYGTTPFGGAYGYGTVFKIDSAGNETILHSFHGGGDGANPNAGVVEDSTGNLYGTTRYGGQGCDGAGCGTVYKIDANGQETVLHRLLDGMDGASPMSGVELDSAGDIYGTAWAGGIFDFGTVFEIDSSGQEKVLHHFQGGTDGVNPVGGVTLDQAGNLYGAASGAGGSQIGVIFTVNTSGAESVLYTFTGGVDGAYPTSHLLVDPAGNIFGMASQGVAGWGSVFEISGGAFNLLYYFTGTPDGGYPVGGLIMDSQGNLYGTTSSAAPYGWGSVFELQQSSR
ncbi:MAG TPA: choice-of-anchor tandem repeat GloVer-containing protein [Candidatus Binatia bacterium]|nr:choice-of-anchor tandem repeat GloVer-containing protein [Candidatus Binatia bacterium]